MPILTARCDTCDKYLERNDIITTHDRNIVCAVCDKEDDLYSAERDLSMYKDRIDINRLNGLGFDVFKLKQELKKLKGDNNAKTKQE